MKNKAAVLTMVLIWSLIIFALAIAGMYFIISGRSFTAADRQRIAAVYLAHAGIQRGPTK